MMPYWEVHDKGRGPWILMVHGFLSSRAQWRANLDALTQFTRPVLVELLGHGRSPSPEAREAYEIASYMRAFEAIRKMRCGGASCSTSPTFRRSKNAR